MKKSLIVKLLAVAAILFFFLPFFTVSCNYGTGTQDLVTLNGIKLVTGVKNSEMNLSGLEDYTNSSDSGKSGTAFKGNLSAVLLLLIPIGVLAVSFMKLKNKEIIVIIAAVICIILCFYLRSDVSSKVGGDYGSYIIIKNKIGFFLTIIVHVCIIGAAIFEAIISKKAKAPVEAVYPSP